MFHSPRPFVDAELDDTWSIADRVNLGGVEVVCILGYVDFGPVVLVTRPQVERQLAGYPPVVLKEPTPEPGPRINCW